MTGWRPPTDTESLNPEGIADFSIFEDHTHRLFPFQKTRKIQINSVRFFFLWRRFLILNLRFLHRRLHSIPPLSVRLGPLKIASITTLFPNNTFKMINASQECTLRFLHSSKNAKILTKRGLQFSRILHKKSSHSPSRKISFSFLPNYYYSLSGKPRDSVLINRAPNS